MAFLTNIAVANVADSLDAEISQSFNISNRVFEIKYYKNDCKSELAHSISEQTNVRSSDEGGNAGFLKLETTAILNSTEVFYEGDRDDIFTGNTTGGYASLCIRADLYLSDNKDISMQFLEKRVNVTVDLETASLSVGDDIDMDRTDAVDNADVGLDYSNYVEAYECDPSNVSDKSYTGTYEQGSVLNICVKSTNPEVIDIETIKNMLVEQDVVDSVIGEKYQYIADGEYNSEIANLDCNTYTNPKVCIGELSLVSIFFEELNPPSLKVSVDVIFAANPSSGGEPTPRLLPAMALFPLKSSAVTMSSLDFDIVVGGAALLLSV
uniref:Uncharacterized protein n=1 Tax=Chaetoceros debilis TaxID=122233 RepID=A0A7S3VG66_9STRA